MNQLHTGSISQSPSASFQVAATQESGKKISRLAQLSAFAGAALFMLVAFATSTATGQTPINSTLSCTRPTTATTSCVDGYYASGWTVGDQYWTYSVNANGFSNIEMTFNTSSSGTGPQKGIVYYKIGAGAEVLVDSYTVSSCAEKNITLPAACNNQSDLYVIIRMKGASAAGGTNRLPINGVFTGTSTGCSGTPDAGTISSTSDVVCDSGNVTLTLSGAASGTGISYQWQSSPNGTSSWANISGADELTYNTTLTTATANTYFRVVTTCGVNSANSPVKHITVNAAPSVSNITGVPASPLLVGATVDLNNATPGGEWSTSNTSVATVDPVTGLVTAVSGGTAVITYTVAGSGGCNGKKTALIHVIWPNTLALYAGYNGANTNVSTATGASSGNLSDNNFTVLDTPSALCASGGLSGLNILPSVNAYDPVAGPYVSYVITPATGKALNFYRIHASTRESDSGATEARIAYRINGGSWIDEDRDVVQNPGGSCGANSNSWDFTKDGANPTVNGITGTLEVAVFPYSPTTKYGTFQLNSLEVYGTVTDDDPCTGTPGGGTITPSSVSICDSGSRWLNFTGDAGVGISYQWEKSTNGTTWTPITGATGATYNTGMLYAATDGPVICYRVKTTCSGSGLFAYSALDTVNVVNTGSAGDISYAPGSDYLKIGTPVSFSSTVSGGYWRSNDTSVVSIDSATGVATPHIPGDAVISYIKPVSGCISRSTEVVNVVYPNTIAAYIGKNGNSVDVDAVTGYTATPLVNNGFGSATKCSNGGYSGLKNDGVTAFDPSYNGAHMSFTLTAPEDITLTGFYVTVRRSNSGIQKIRMAYNDGVSGWIDDGVDYDVEADDCGYSADVITFEPAFLPSLLNGQTIEFAIYGFDPAAVGGTLQINSIDITANGASAVLSRPGASASESSADVMETLANDISIYPNPVNNILYIGSAEAVDVRIMSIDGRKLMDVQSATSVDVSNLTDGMYIIQVYNASTDALIKTARFSKL